MSAAIVPGGKRAVSPGVNGDEGALAKRQRTIGSLAKSPNVRLAVLLPEHLCFVRFADSKLSQSYQHRDGGRAVHLQDVRRTSDLQAPIMLLSGHAAEVLSLKFSPEGRSVACAPLSASALLREHLTEQLR